MTSKARYIIILLMALLPLQVIFAQKEPDKDELPEPMLKKRSELFMDANKQRILENPDEAIKLYKKVLEIDPDHAPSLYELARLYAGQGRAEDAVLLLEKAIGLEKDNVWYKLELAGIYKRSRQFEKLIGIYKELIEKYPEKIDYYYDLALAYMIMGDYREAIDTYDQIEEKIGVTERISLQKQKLYLNQDKTGKALEEVENLVEAYPENTRYLQILAESYVTNGKDKKALETYRKIAEIDPANPYIRISLSDFYRKQGEEQKAFEELKLGFANPKLDLDSKIQILLSYYTAEDIYGDKKEQAFELAEKLIEAHPDDPRALSIYGDLLYRNGKLEPALETFNKVLQSDSSQYSVWEQKLFILNELRKNKKLAETSEAAIELFPMQPLPYLFNGFAHVQMKEFGQARKALENGSRLVVGNDMLLAQFYSSLGDVYHSLEDFTKSDEYYEKALKINPNDAYVLNNYSYYLSLRGKNLEQAREMAAKANEVEPGNPSFQDTYGWVLYKLGEYEEAEIWIKKALDHQEAASGVLLEHYGDVLYKLGRKDEALKYWEKARKAGGEISGKLDEKIETKTLVE